MPTPLERLAAQKLPALVAAQADLMPSAAAGRVTHARIICRVCRADNGGAFRYLQQNTPTHWIERHDEIAEVYAPDGTPRYVVLNASTTPQSLPTWCSTCDAPNVVKASELAYSAGDTKNRGRVVVRAERLPPSPTPG